MKHFGKGDNFPAPTGVYRKSTTVPMVQVDEAFTCNNREGEEFKGQAGDFLVEDGYGGFYVVGSKFHKANYEPV